MDKSAVKDLLESYRPENADDPIFAEALREVAADPKLAAWFEDMQRFDAVMSEKFQGAHVPSDLKHRILQGYQPAGAAPKPNPLWAWYIPTSIAALILFGFFLGHVLFPPPRSMSPLELQAIAYTAHMPALQFVCFQPQAVAKWVNAQPAAQQVGLKLPTPDSSMAMVMIGASVTEWNGHHVVMICLQDGKRMAMLYVLKAKDFPEMKDGSTQTFQEADWVIRATKANGQVHLLTAKGRPEDLDFKMPFSEGV